MELKMAHHWYKRSGRVPTQQENDVKYAVLALLELRRVHGDDVARGVIAFVERSELRTCPNCAVLTIHTDDICQKCCRPESEDSSPVVM
jgi:hypothetical protein